MKLANKNYPNSKAIVGYLDMNGLGTDVDSFKAVHYLSAAANDGVSSAMNNYAICLLEGFGCSQSWMQAAKWFERASDLGNVPAKVNLAHCALIGRAYANVRALLDYACSKGDPHGHLTAAICYYNGIGGFPSDNRSAEQHLNAAKDLGSYHALEAMDYWEHWILKFYKREWMKLDSLKWDMCVPS